jgi:hypothetical protein
MKHLGAYLRAYILGHLILFSAYTFYNNKLKFEKSCEKAARKMFVKCTQACQGGAPRSHSFREADRSMQKKERKKALGHTSIILRRPIGA